MGILKSALMFKAGKAAYDRFNRSRGGGNARGGTRPAKGRRAGNGSGGTLGRLASSVLGSRR